MWEILSRLWYQHFWCLHYWTVEEAKEPHDKLDCASNMHIWPRKRRRWCWGCQKLQIETVWAHYDGGHILSEPEWRTVDEEKFHNHF